MCEYCGCQALTAIATLTREHDEALSAVRLAERALDRGDETALVAACAGLRDLLRPHTAVEEGALFPALEHEFPDEMAVLHREHERIEGALDEAAGRHGPGWQDRVGSALALLRAHIRKEQDGVFPAALGILTPAQWDMLAGVRAQQAAGSRLSRGLMEEVFVGQAGS
jgi:hemerythrin-like domain-containing protein